MSNSVLTPDIIAKEAVMILDNNLVMAKQVHRGYENEFSKKVNGYKIGETVSIRKPTDFTPRTTITASSQDVVEGTTSITVDQVRGVDFEFSSTDLTLDIGELSERVIKPAMVQLANAVDTAVMGLYKQVPNWVGTPGETVDAFEDFAKAPEFLDETAVPQESRSAVLSPADHWAIAGDQSRLFNNSINQQSYRRGKIGEVGGVETFMSQNVPTHVAGADVEDTGATIDGALTSATIAYTAVKDTMTQTITTDGWTAGTPALAEGDVFTIDGVYDVNPVTKARLPFEKKFTVVSAESNATNHLDITFYPAMIWTGAFKNMDTDDADLDGASLTFMGEATTGYRQNLVFHKNAFSLVMVPLVSPPGAVEVGRQSYKGTSVRVIPYYDGTNDISKWRLDVLFGVKAVDPRLAVRLSGTASS